jgi:hypothetical protein
MWRDGEGKRAAAEITELSAVLARKGRARADI